MVGPAVVPQIQTGPEALAAQVTQYKSTTASSTTASPTAEQGIARAQVLQPQLQQFPGGTIIYMAINISMPIEKENLNMSFSSVCL